MGPNERGAKMLSGAVLPYMAIADNKPNMPRQWSPCICDRKTASTLTKDWWKRLNCCWVPSPQSIKNKRPCTFSTWALGFLSAMGTAEAVPSTVMLKLLTFLQFVLEGCQSVDVAESGLLHVGVDLLHSLLGVVLLGGCGLLLSLGVSPEV